MPNHHSERTQLEFDDTVGVSETCLDRIERFRKSVEISLHVRVRR